MIYFHLLNQYFFSPVKPVLLLLCVHEAEIVCTGFVYVMIIFFECESATTMFLVIELVQYIPTEYTTEVPNLLMTIAAKAVKCQHLF
jgi:hypothetical protein